MLLLAVEFGKTWYIYFPWNISHVLIPVPFISPTKWGCRTVCLEVVDGHILAKV
jgi:hypothetical protein